MVPFHCAFGTLLIGLTSCFSTSWAITPNDPGLGADDIGIQCGGWTIEWQGAVGPVTSGGTTILAGIRTAVGDGAKVSYSADGSGAEGADVAIVVVGERPYAEGSGDNGRLLLPKEDQETFERVQAAGVPIVLVLLSGRPLMIGDDLESSNAVVAAWLPGTEGEGVADVLFGDYAPTGKLSVTWPRSVDQEPINVGDEPYDPAYPYGFGLSY